MAVYNPEHKQVLDELILGHPLVRPGKMFGFPAYYAGKKLAICLYEQGGGLKIPEPTVKRMRADDPNVIPFQPMGKARMREWVQINLERSEDYRQYREVFDESIAYVISQAQKD
jgi:hypothetical protein